MSDDNNSELEELRIDRQIGRRADSSSGGGRIVQDGRVSSFINWLLAGVGSAVVWVLWHFGTQFSDEISLLRGELVKTNTQLAISIQQNARLESDMKDHEARLRTLEGRNLRGPPRAEPGRGN